MEKFIAKTDFEVLNYLVLESDVIYISEPIHIMNGIFAYARKVFNSDRSYLGMVRDDFFYKNIKPNLQEN